MKIAIAGFQHETNTFAPNRTGLREFEMSDSWPGLLTGQRLITETKGMNLPVAGAIDAARSSDSHVSVVPILWCAAEPGGFVTDQAFDSVSSRLINGIRDAGAVDGIYLDLHGAMVTESVEDGETELLRRLRAAFGTTIPIGISLDLHANVSSELVDLVTLITVYRTYPHLDMARTGSRCMLRLIQTVSDQLYFSAFRQADFLIPLHAQCTDEHPCKNLYQSLEHVAVESSEWVEIAMGFTAADVYACGPSVVAYASTPERANELAGSTLAKLVAEKPNFSTELLSATEAVQKIKALNSTKPVVLADVQDNPGAGGTSDTTGLLHVLIDMNIDKVVLGVMCDRDVALMAHHHGLGSRIECELGAKSGLDGQLPVAARFRVAALSDGEIAYTGQMYGGGTASLGPSCLLAVDHSEKDIRIVVSSVRIQCLDRALFTHFGIDLTKTRVICVKSTLHYRADFEPLASELIPVASPGLFKCELEETDYRKLRAGVSCL